MKKGLDILLRQSAYNVCRPLNSDSFVKFCKDRDIDVSIRVLERLEELRIFLPIARATQWPYVEKIRRLDNGGHERLGQLEENETWAGPTETRHASFYFGRSDTPAWIETGRLWDPHERSFVPWDSYLEDGWRRMESYYSPFQAYELCWHLSGLRQEIAAEFFVLQPETWSEDILTWAGQMIEFEKSHCPRYDIAFLCQVLSDRYYPQTQTNNRHITIPSPKLWDWYAYCDQFDPLHILEALEVDVAEVRHDWKMMVMDAKHCDPLEAWYDLLSYVSIDKRKKLKGEALRAQTWYSMEHMLRLFYADLTGDELPTPERPITDKFVPGAESPKPSNPLEDLERLSHEYEINPRPTLILLVEGESESTVLPETIGRVFGVSIEKIGVEVAPLYGVANFAGSKRYDRDSAVKLFIDYHHAMGTIVFIILDNEGSAKHKRQRLISRKSDYQDRMVTNEEYVQLWDKCIEFDNFDDDEITIALNRLGQGTYSFSREDVEAARSSFGKLEETSLMSIYEHRTGCGLNKVGLLRVLFETITADDLRPDRIDRRPILRILRNVVRLARENTYKPDEWHREHLALKGLYGRPTGEKRQDPEA